jgi:outer membrane biosynthesis protein TonB
MARQNPAAAATGGTGAPAHSRIPGNREAYIVGGIVVVGAALALLQRRKANKAAANAPANASAMQSAVTDNTYDTSVMDAYNQLQAEYDQLAGKVQGLSMPTSTGTTTPPPPVPTPVPGPPTRPIGPQPGPLPPIPVPPPHPPVNAPPPPPQPPAPRPATHTYIVRSGDNLSKIAAANHTTLAMIKQLNPVYWTNPKYNQGNLIWAGDHVVLPGAG